MVAEREIINDMLLDKILIAIERARISNPVKHFLLTSASTTTREAYFEMLVDNLAEIRNLYVLELSAKKWGRFNAQLIQKLRIMFPEKIEPSPELEIAEVMEEVAKNLKAENAVLLLVLMDVHIAAKELTAILTLLHRGARMIWPVVYVLGGDISLTKKVGEAVPFAERAFEVHKIGLRHEVTNR